MSLVPMLSAKLLKPTTLGTEGGWAEGLARGAGSFFTGMEQGYSRLLHWTLGHRALVALICAALLAGSLVIVKLGFVGWEVMPVTDEGEVRVQGEMEVGTRIEVLGKTFDDIYRIVEDAVPEMTSSVAYIGGKPWRPGETNRGEVRISLVPLAERTRSDEEIAKVLQRRLAHVPGVRIRTRSGQGLFLLRMATRGMEHLTVEVRGHDLETACELAKEVEGRIEDVDGITDTRVSLSSGTPEELVKIDRRKAEEMHLSVSRIGSALQTVLGGTRAGEYREAGDEYRILVRLKDAKGLSLEEILDVTVTNSLGEPVVLRNVVRTSPRKGPVMIDRIDQHRVVDVRTHIRGRDMGSVVADVNERLRGIEVPERFSVALGGDYEEQLEVFYGKPSYMGLRLGGLRMSLILAIILVYMVMACLFESLRDPFVVMFSVPFAAIGVILMLYLTKTTLNIQSFIGCIVLAGIVVNNAILLVDHANLLRRRDGMPLSQAIEEAGRRRLRPILMTALTTSLALTPLAIGLGEGGEAQAPMARAVIGGLLSSTLITLVFLPTVYTIFEGLGKGAPDELLPDGGT
jgi:HAE1 family hydrophobic/amphiphilic exporter-1